MVLSYENDFLLYNMYCLCLLSNQNAEALHKFTFHSDQDISQTKDKVNVQHFKNCQKCDSIFFKQRDMNHDL